VTYISRRERALHPPSHPRGKLKELKDERARTRAREREREREREEEMRVSRDAVETMKERKEK